MTGLQLSAAASALLLAGFIVHAQENPYAESYFRMLTERGIATDSAGLRTFLSSHIPGPEDAERLKQHLADLGHDDYARREAAMQALLARPPRSLETLEALVDSKDPEVKWRARLVLDSLRHPGNDLLYAALVVINARKVQGLADVVLGVAPLCQSESMQTAMRLALIATATEQDAEILRGNLRSDDARVRMACLNALLTAVGAPAVPDIMPLLDDSSDQVRFEAASQLLPHRRAESLRALGKLLTSEHLTVRNRSIHALRSTLKVSLPYSGYEPPEDRAKHAAEWQKTIEANLEARPDAATSAVPGDFVPQLVLQSPRHRSLILVNRDGSIQTKELDRSGMRVVALPNGNLLTAHSRQATIRELDAADKVVWESKALDELPILVARRADGTTLAATAEGSLVELNASGDMIRKTDVGILCDFEPLANGETLLLSFADRKVRQIDATGRTLWQQALPAPPTSMCLTNDGHALITLQGSMQLMELNLTNRELKTLASPFRSATQIEQLNDGRLVLVDAAGAHFADRQGALIETIKLFPNSSGPF